MPATGAGLAFAMLISSAAALRTVTAASDLRLPGRRVLCISASNCAPRQHAASLIRLLALLSQVAVATTAALPWMTGTSINPLMRAAHLAKKGYPTNLVLPWLEKEQQPKLFPQGITFDTRQQQEAWIFDWLRRAEFSEAELDGLTLRWYDAIYEDFLGAVIQRSGVDIAQAVPARERDVVFLDEPEHLNWYHHGMRWQQAYTHVVGVLHTNYNYYSRYEERSGGAGDIPPEVREQIMDSLNNLVCLAHVDVNIRLSATLPRIQRGEQVCNVHGVRAAFLSRGRAVASLSSEARADALAGGAYLLGKALWTKGYANLFDQLKEDMARGAGARDEIPVIDAYGSGRDEAEIRQRAAAEGLPVRMHDGIDHASDTLSGYRVFVNPSTSEVLCTTTAEALAMGKKVVIPRHPSNDFFAQFANCIYYGAPSELVETVRDALASPPLALSDEEQRLLSWDAATERLIDAARQPVDEGERLPRDQPLAAAAYAVHNMMGTPLLNDYFRENSGATPLHATWPERLDYITKRRFRLLRRERRKQALLLKRRLPRTITR